MTGEAPNRLNRDYEILVWNIQRDMVEKFSNGFPWTVAPFKRIPGHQGSIVDFVYMPVA